MAIFDWSLQTIKRSAQRAPSRSAVAAAAYRSGTYLRDLRTGSEHDFTKRRGIYSEIVLPPGVMLPDLVAPSSRSELQSRLWNSAEAAETRCNSVVAREIVLALPHELSREQQQRLTRTYAGFIAKSLGVAVDFAVHPPGRGGDHRNVHAHILFTTRRVADGFVFGSKTRELDAAATGGPIIKGLRERWADFANLMLLDAGLNVAIDHRSLADRGLDQVPRHHLGPQATNRARSLRAMAARLQAEATAIEREVLPHVWPLVEAPPVPARPERVEKSWAEWAWLHEPWRQERAAEKETDEDAARVVVVAPKRPAVLQLQIIDEGDMDLPLSPALAKRSSQRKSEENRAGPPPMMVEPSTQDQGRDAREIDRVEARPHPRPDVRRFKERDGWERG